MATTIKTTVAMNNGNSVANSETRVICPKCGAEIAIPAHESVGCGIHVTIGKDSGLGTIVLPAASRKSNTQTSAISRLMVMAEGNPEMMVLVQQLSSQIEDGGYMDVDGIVRRWIPSQCLHMQYSKLGFHKVLTNKGSDYSWKVLLDDLKRQAKMFKAGDMESFQDRNRWYNKEVALEMIHNYCNELSRVIEEMLQHRVKSCKGKKYIPLKVTTMNNGKGVFVKEVNQINKWFIYTESLIRKASTITELYQAVKAFVDKRSELPRFHETMSPAFTNAYKAAGSYYTMKDLILFEGCAFKDQDGCMISQDDSLEVLEHIADAFKDKDVLTFQGYKFLGILREFLDINKFDFKKTTQNWAAQSEARREARKAAKNSRRTRK